MKTNEIINLDFRKEENRKIIQQALKKIKPLAKYSDEEQIPFEMIEKVITVLSKKYNMRIREIIPDIWGNSKNSIWRAIIIIENTNSPEKIQAVKMQAAYGLSITAHGLSVYELFAKVAICMYSIKEKVGERREVN